MKVVPRIDALVEKDAVTKQLPLKVCMHSLGEASSKARVLREAHALVEAGISVSLVDVASERTRPVEENICGISVKHMIRPNWFISTRFKTWFLIKFSLMIILGAVQLLRTPADIYHALSEKALPACYIAARLRHKPLVFESPDLPLSDPSVTRWTKLSALSGFLLSAMVPRCAGVITVSQPIAQEIHQRYHGPEVTLVRNTPMYQAVGKSNRLRQYLRLAPEVRLALYQGNLQPNRGLDRLVRAASFLDPNIVIVLLGAGRGIPQTQIQLEALIASERVEDRVKILPTVPYAELLNWTASADIGLNVLPPDHSLSIRWCLPNKFFEYLMAGLPVLTSQLDAVVEVIRTYDVGQVVFSTEPADIGAAINVMLADQEALARMRRNALQAAKQEFCWGKECQRLILLYQGILVKRPIPRGRRKASPGLE
jgi:glycosyltransferase involved in cell wall biosynthesis